MDYCQPLWPTWSHCTGLCWRRHQSWWSARETRAIKGKMCRKHGAQSICCSQILPLSHPNNTYNTIQSWSHNTTVDIGCLCTSHCLMWRFFSDYFSCFLSRLIRWFVAFVLHCFSLFALFVVLKFSSPVSLLFSLWHWAQGLYFVASLLF